MKRRIVSFILCLVMLFSLLPALFNNPVKAATASQNNIVARADYFYNLTWTAQSTVYGWNYNYTFYAGSTYRVPYGQPINSGAYVGYYVSIDDFLAAANTPGSVFYTSRSTYDSTSSVYYATDCSAFVSWCWGVDRKTTYSIPQISTYIGMATAANAYSLQLGDALNSNDVGHVVLVTDLVYSGSTLTSIEITEQTPPQMKRSWYTPSELGSKYGGYYGIYRYSGSVPAAPDGSTNDDSGSTPGGSGSSITSQYYPACGSSYGNLTEAFASIGITLTWDLQTKIAEKNNIANYEGTVEQNTTILNLLKAGTLLNPNYVPVSYYPACDSSAGNLYDAFSSIGISLNWDLQVQIAAANGISGYEGTAEQNTTILNLLKAGKLIVPGTGSGDDSGGSSGGGSVTDGKTGYDRGYAGGMAGTGEYKAFGLDVSSWQGSSLNFTRIKNAGYDYVILRAGTSNGKDECFETYYTNAKAAGLDVGVYYYSYATSVSAVKADMEDFLSYIAGKKYEYPVYFDYEDSTQQALSSSLSQQICLTAMDMLAAEGYLVGMYTGKYFSTLLPMETICAKYEVWIAHYLAVGDGSYDGTGDYWKYGPTYASQYGMYQFTDSVWINGYGPYDGDVCYKDYPSIVKTYGFNGYGSSVPDEETYFDQCTYYPSHCTFTTSQKTSIFSEPRTAKTGNTSVALEDAPNGTTYTSIGLYVNSGGNIFYEVLTSSGEKGYIYSGYTTYGAPVISDVKISGHSVPGNHTLGNTFTVSGTVSSTYNTLGNVSAYIYSGNSTTGTPVTGGSAKATNNKYSLSGSAIDDATSFGDLSVGTYTYVIAADYTSYYAISKNELGTTTGTAKLVTQAFNVVDSSGGGTTTESYFDKCTFYPSHCTFTTNRDTGIFSEPRTAKTGNTSVKLEDAPNGTTYTSIGLYVNSGGNIFYEVLTADGQKGYIYSGYTEYGKKVYSDIKLSGAKYPNGIVKGNVFEVSGTISSSYNTLGTAKVYIYSGTNTSGTAVTGGTGKVSNNKYVLAGSAIDDATSFGSLATGLYTYRIQVTFTSYYALSPTELGTNSGTRTLKTHYFTVVSSSVNQDSCSHNNKTVVATAPTCTDTGTQVVYCTKCGLTEKVTVEATGHSYGSYVVIQAATCTTDGYKEKTCSACGKVYTKTIPASHNYTVTTIPGTCTQYAAEKYTCSGCGDTYTTYAGEYTDWSTTKPSGIDAALIESKTQYRYRDYSTLTSYEANLDGYTLVSSKWEQTGTGKVTYVKSWPSGFSTSSNTYATYNKIGNKVTASETATNKTTVNSDAIVGYLWYHWCSNGGDTSTSYQTNSNWCFHVFYSTTTPSQANNYDSSDGSYKLSSSTQCASCKWYWPVAVYEQNYTTYKNQFTYEKWSAWSSWSDEVVTKTDTREVATRTVYRYIDAQLGDHTWNSGKVTTAATCTENGVKTYTCTSCSATKTESIASTGHTWNAASCTQPKTCANCGKTSGSSLGHSYSSKVTTAPTCTSNGVRTYTCSTCSDSYTEVIAKLGHSYTSKVTAPTCTSQGYTTYTCSTCGSSYKDSFTNATNHSYTSQVTTAATCTTAGVRTYTCSKCSDSHTEMISATGHSYVNGKCSNCNDTKIVSVNGTFNDWNGQNMTWTDSGYTFSIQLNAGSYSFKLIKDGTWLGNNGTIENTTTATSDIGWEFTQWGGDCTLVASGGTYFFTFNFDTNMLVITCDHTHKYEAGKVVAPTCTENGYTVYECACGDSYNGDIVAALDHSYSSKVTTAATCTTDGVKTFTCGTCGDKYTEVIPAAGHNYVGGKCGNCGDTKVVSVNSGFNDWAGQNMTWTSSGYTFSLQLDAGTYKFKLIKDGTWLGNNGEIWDTTTATSDIGWEFTDWGNGCTLIATGGTYYFTFHFDTNMLVITYDHTHVYAAGEVVAPTCTAKGYTVYTCACGDTQNRDEVAALGHNHVGKVTTAATCTTDGVKTFTCSNCGDTYTEAIAKLGHSYTSKVTAPTCTEKGYTTHTCSRCSDSYKDSYVDALGHSYVGDTCTSCGNVRAYYLIGWINGANMGCEEDAANLGNYKFVDGKVSVIFDQDSYVFVKTGDNAAWYMTDGWLGQINAAKLYNTNKGIDANKLYVPGGMSVTFTLVVNNDETLDLSYIITDCDHSYTSVTVDPTCTEKGSITYTCTKCGFSYTQEIPATGHSYVGGKCSVCGDTKIVSINGDFNGWNGDNMTWTDSGYTLYIVLSAGTYEFKLIKDGTWLGNNGEIFDNTAAAENGWKFEDAGNCKLVATGGTYTFTFNFDTDMLVVTNVHTHAYVAGEVVAPTCTAKGYTVYTCACGDSYNGDETAALGHDYKAVVTEPTCTDKGYTTHTCSRCSDSYVDSYVDAKGHSYSSKVTTAATCTADGVKTFTCGNCNHSYTEAIAKLGHSYSSKVTAPTCTSQGYTTHTCSRCSDSFVDSYVDAKGHSYSSRVTTTATCTTDGVKTFTCGTCGDKYTEAIPATGHSYVGGKCAVCGDIKSVTLSGDFNSWEGQNMTWTASGYTFSIQLNAGTYGFKVIKDGTWLGNNGEIADTTTATSSVGWEFADWAGDCHLVATGGTYYFTFHFDTNMLVITYDHTHAYTAGEVVAPTCTAKGYTVYTCACGDTQNRDEKAALGHNHVGKVTTAATCEKDGVKTFTCSSCGDKYTEAITKLGHDYKSVVTKPTCTAQGYTTHACSRCSDSFVDSYVDALGHSYDNGVITTNPTCTDKGVMTFTCGNCNHSYTEVIPSTGHSYEDVVTAPGCTTQGYTTHTCSVCGDSYVDSYTDPVGHIWNNGMCECGAYALQHTSASLSLESEIKYNLYFYLADENIKLENVGLLTFKTLPTDATIENADYVLDTLAYDADFNSYAMRSQGVPAKEMGDNLYLRLYATMEDGTVIYGKLITYSAKKFAMNTLNRASSSDTLKNTVVALMNYGAEAQKLLGYKTEELMNAEISAEYQAKQIGYNADLLNARIKAEDAKIAGLAATDGAFTSKSATLTMKGALAINYLFLPGKTVDNGQMTFYYWTASTYASAEELTLENADGTIAGELDGSYYQAVYGGISAKDIDKTIYVLAVYESEGETCLSGVVSYSIEHFCRSQINSATQNNALCKALSVYSYYAKLIFNVD